MTQIKISGEDAMHLLRTRAWEKCDPGAVLSQLRRGIISEMLMDTGAKLIVRRSGEIMLSGYSQDGSDVFALVS